jgi:hypothetical protein
VSKTVDVKWPQSVWNIDKMDGTGASLFNLDLTKMQMFYIDYTWYGAGGIRFGFKNNRGEVIYCHRVPNNNVNTEAYMRSGNLVARYETSTIAPYTYATAWAIGTTTGTITVADTTFFPASGTLVVSAQADTGANIEYMTYSSKTATTFVISARAQTGGGVAFTFLPTTTSPIKIELYSPQNASTLSHWGSSVVMDGRYDDDRSNVFNQGMQTPITIANSGDRRALMSLRLAPSVDNGLTGNLGTREIINRMQLTPRGMDVLLTTASTAVKIELILNGQVSGTDQFIPVAGSSLAQICYHSANTTVSGGEAIFGFLASSSSGTTNIDLNQVRDIGNSIIGGGTSLSVPTGTSNVYPDGPDVITVVATSLTATSTPILSRLSWTEAQA